MSYRDYHKSLAPTALANPQGAARSSAVGDTLDELLHRAKLATKARMPTLAPADGLERIAGERGTFRGVNESLEAWALRVRSAWDAWAYGGTALGVLRALASAGYPRAIICIRKGRQFQLDAAGNMVVTTLAAGSFLTDIRPSMWATFVVIFDEVNFPAWGGAPPAADSDEADRIRAIIRRWKSAFSRCTAIVTVTAGHTWDYPAGRTWDTQGGTWDGHATQEWTP